MEKVFETLGDILNPAIRKCHCVNITMGSYGNQVELTLPWNGDKVGIDRCLLKEVKGLWELGIRTTSSCCGHNVAPPFIGVINEDIPKMKALGYTWQENNCNPSDKSMFIPKSI